MWPLSFVAGDAIQIELGEAYAYISLGILWRRRPSCTFRQCKSGCKKWYWPQSYTTGGVCSTGRTLLF